MGYTSRDDKAASLTAALAVAFVCVPADVVDGDADGIAALVGVGHDAVDLELAVAVADHSKRQLSWRT